MYEDQANNRVYMTQSAKLSANPSAFDVEEVLDASVASQSQEGNSVTALQKLSLNGERWKRNHRAK